MAIYKRGDQWWYDFSYRGQRYRKNTEQTVKARAKHVEACVRAALLETGTLPGFRKPVLLFDFLETCKAQWIDQHAAGQLARATMRSYLAGCRLLEGCPALHHSLRIDRLHEEHIKTLTFPGGPANTNCALRTLRRVFSLALKQKLIHEKPAIQCVEETGRDILIEPWMERAILEHAPQPLYDIFTLVSDTGMRPEEVMRLRWDQIHWDRRVIAILKSKTSRRSGRSRFVPLSARVANILERRTGMAQAESIMVRHAGIVEFDCPWVFPSKASSGGYRTSVGKQWRATIAKVNALAAQNKTPELPVGIDLYCGRHTFATNILDSTKNLAIVQQILGHSNIQTTRKYIHPDTSDLADVVDALNQRRSLQLVKKAGT